MQNIEALSLNRIKVVITLLFPFVFFLHFTQAQIKWTNADVDFSPLPEGIHVYKTYDSLDGTPFIAYYAEAMLQNKQLTFTTDTSFNRRLTPSQFYTKNNYPKLVVNGTFFSFQTNSNLNVVIKKGEIIAHNLAVITGRGQDSLQYFYPFRSAIGISSKRKADIAWTLTDSSKGKSTVYAFQQPQYFRTGFTPDRKLEHMHPVFKCAFAGKLPVWKMQTAIGGGPVLLQNGNIRITNEEERMFTGNAINDKHPRTCMGYTNDGRLIIMVIQGRSPGIAEGATLQQSAQLLKDIGCVEALNLDGGGSSCMLINGKQTIQPSDKEGQRAVPAVFLIH